MNTISYLPLRQISARQDSELLAAATEVVRSGRYLNGPWIRQFETDFSRYAGTGFCVTTGNGLDALTLILSALKRMKGWKEEDEIIVPALTFVATALAVSRAGLRPVFADVDENFLLSAQEAERKITGKTRAILPVHLYGRTADMPRICALARQYRLEVIEDAAQAHGAILQGKKAGSWGIAAAFSFYPGKNLGALGDGGCVTTSCKELAEEVRRQANYGADRKYYHTVVGCNSRMDEIQAAFLCRKLALLDRDNARRRELAGLYNREILSPHITLPYRGDTSQSVFHIYPVLTPHREAFMSRLQENGIETLIHYPLPLHRQTVYREHENEEYPQAERAAAQEVSLPLHPLLTEEEIHHIARTINSFQP